MKADDRKKIRRILAVLILLTIVFIWGHSLMSREDSSKESDWVRQLLTPVLELLVGEGNVTEHLVRKLAHFCEYALLGLELLLFFAAAPGAYFPEQQRPADAPYSTDGQCSAERRSCAEGQRFAERQRPGKRRFLPCRQTAFRYRRAALLSEAHVMFTAMTDETIQLFSGRGSQLQDVWLDNAGGACGALFGLLIIIWHFRALSRSSVSR